MIAAIYSRKSILTGKGESIENQINLCKEYAEKYLNIDQFLIYEDEGYSGGNTNRPRFKDLITDAKNKKFNVLICYRLDRISRNVGDFSCTLEILQDNNVDFISIKEQFDTTTPMGRAMVYISSVFAQLERETIAERVKDNMLQLAKTGRWLGGQEPYGYSAKRITYLDETLKEKSLMKLSPIEDELKIVKLIFNRYLELHSISQVVKYLRLSGIKGKNGGEFATMQVSRLLSNPLYVKSTKEIEQYLRNIGINVFGEPNGNGYLTYNKTRNITKHRDVSEWIAAIGKHPGIIEPTIWLEVQKILNSNKNNPLPRLGTSDNNALLTGILKCTKCNSNMIIKQGHWSKTKNNIRYDYYVCGSKNSSCGKKCDNKNIRADLLDKIVIDKINAFSKELLIFELTEAIKNEVDNNYLNTRIKNIEQQIEEKEKAIHNLVKKLSLNENEQVDMYIFTEIEELTYEISDLKKQLKTTKSSKIYLNTQNDNHGLILDTFTGLDNIFFTIDNNQLKRTLVKTIVNTILWDGETKTVDIIFRTDK